MKRPLDHPAGTGQALEKVFFLADGIDQQGSIFGADDLIDQGKRLIRTIRKQGTDMPRFPAIADECRRIRSERGSLPPGQAVATTAGRLQAQYVIHAVGPVWHGGKDDEGKTLSSCYRESMRIADELKLHSIAFPAISTGIFGYPVEQAAWVAIPTLIDSLRSAEHLVLVFMVLFDKPMLDVFANTALAQRKPESAHPYEVSIATYA